MSYYSATSDCLWYWGSLSHFTAPQFTVPHVCFRLIFIISLSKIHRTPTIYLHTLFPHYLISFPIILLPYFLHALFSVSSLFKQKTCLNVFQCMLQKPQFRDFKLFWLYCMWQRFMFFSFLHLSRQWKKLSSLQGKE